MSLWNDYQRTNARRLVEAAERPRIELGSGYSPEPGFIHVELNSACPEVDWCGPVEDLPFDDDTFYELRAVDILEHLSYMTTADVLAEWFRVMKPGATGYIQVPDAETIMTRYAQSPAALVVPHLADLPPIVSTAWRIMGGHLDDVYAKDGDEDWRLNAHFAMFSEDSLRWYLTQSGFRIDSIGRNQHPNLLVNFYKPGGPT